MTTKDILKETLGSLKFPDAAWDELAEKIDNNNKSTRKGVELETIFLANSEWNLERGCKVMTFDEFKTALGDMAFIKRLNEPVDTPDDIKKESFRYNIVCARATLYPGKTIEEVHKIVDKLK